MPNCVDEKFRQCCWPRSNAPSVRVSASSQVSLKWLRLPATTGATNFPHWRDSKPKLSFEDDGSNAIARLKVKVKLDGSISNAQQKITAFVKAVPATGRSQIEQKEGLALTIINPDQYRDEIYRRVAAGANHAVSFYGAEYAVNVSGLDRAVAWSQVSNTEVFLYIPYSFTLGK